jgi:hypothetical protein
MFSTDWPKDDWDRFGPRDNAPERYRAMARAAIAEMRVPTEWMLVAKQGVDFIADGTPDDLGEWEAMIDAALKEEA